MIKQTVADRIIKLCEQRGIKPNELATRSGVTPSSVYSMLDPKRKEVTINLIKKLCDGLEISLREFFDDEIFDEVEQEIK